MVSLALLLGVAAVGQTAIKPEHALIAWRDLSHSVPDHLKPQTRYLIRGEYAHEEEVINGHMQHLSRSPIIRKPVLVEKQLYRVYLSDYRINPAVYERLAGVDPYAHWDVDLKGKKERTHNPLLIDSKDGMNAMEYLVYFTKSNTPILTAEWFFNQTAIQQGRVAGYYDFLEIKTVKDFEALIGFDRKLAKDFGQTQREATSISDVTVEGARGIVRDNTLGGGFWKSLDFKVAKGLKNPLRILGEDLEKQKDATEGFGHLPNGFWATYAADNNDKLQEVAPNFIAGDTRSKSTDKQVHPNMGCLRCHTNAGLRDLHGFFRRNFKGGPDGLDIGSPDHAKYERFREEYSRSLEPFLRRDRERFAEAVTEATGLEAKKYLEYYAAYWERYRDAEVDLAWAARSVGTTPEELRRAFDAQLPRPGRVIQIDPRYGALDTVLTGLLNGDKISISSWEEVYPLAVIAWRGNRK